MVSAAQGPLGCQVVLGPQKTINIRILQIMISGMPHIGPWNHKVGSCFYYKMPYYTILCYTT